MVLYKTKSDQNNTSKRTRLGVQYIFIEIQYIYNYTMAIYILYNKKYIVAIMYLYIILVMRQKCPTIKRKWFSLFIY